MAAFIYLLKKIMLNKHFKISALTPGISPDSKRRRCFASWGLSSLFEEAAAVARGEHGAPPGVNTLREGSQSPLLRLCRRLYFSYLAAIKRERGDAN